MSDDTANLIRLVNIGLSLVAFIWLLLKASKFWPHYAKETRAYTTALLAFALTVLYGSSEAWAIRAEGGPRLLVATVAVLCMLYALWTTRGRQGAR